MTRDLVNPNTGDSPLPLTAAELARVAKTGCALCHGAGVVVFRAKASRADLDGKPKNHLCRCTSRFVLGRIDLREIDGRLCWLPRPAAAEAST